MIGPGPDIDSIVKHYLSSRGYVRAAAEMEANGVATLPPSQINGRTSSFVEDMLVLGPSNQNSLIYEQSYDVFRAWAMAALEISRAEFLSLCFPLFSHCYIGMIRNNFIESAIEFWRKWSVDHRLCYSDELQRLSSVISQESLQSEDFLTKNDFVRNLLSSRFIVKMSRFSYGLMTSFLMSEDLKLVASILNERINFQLTDSLPVCSSNPLVESGGFSVPGDNVQLSTVASNHLSHHLPKIKWGIPGKGLESISGIGQIGPEAFSHMPNTQESPYREWISTLIKPRVVMEYVNKLKAAGSSGTRSLGPESRKRDRESRSRGNALDPSIVFGTVSNSHDGMICMNTCGDLTQVVAGFRDNCVRVWRLDSTLNNSDENTRNKFGQGLDNPGCGHIMTEIHPSHPPHRITTLVPLTLQLRQQAEEINATNNSPIQMALLQLRGHTAPVYGVSQEESQNCRLIASCSADSTVRIWDTKVSQCVGKHGAAVPAWDVAFSPLGGYYFASANLDGTLALFSTERTTPIRLMVGHFSDATCVNWHGNAVLLLSGSDDKTTRLWDIRSGECVRVFRCSYGSATPISCVSCSSRGNIVAAGTDGGAINTWDIGTSKQIGVLQGHAGPVHSLTFGATSDALISGGADCTVRVWDIQQQISHEETEDGSRPIDEGIALLRPRHTFHTKFSSVFRVHCTPGNLVFAGGPFSLTHATGSVVATERETVRALGLARPQAIR